MWHFITAFVDLSFPLTAPPPPTMEVRGQSLVVAQQSWSWIHCLALRHLSRVDDCWVKCLNLDPPIEASLSAQYPLHLLKIARHCFQLHECRFLKNWTKIQTLRGLISVLFLPVTQMHLKHLLGQEFWKCPYQSCLINLQGHLWDKWTGRETLSFQNPGSSPERHWIYLSGLLRCIDSPSIKCPRFFLVYIEVASRCPGCRQSMSSH